MTSDTPAMYEFAFRVVQRPADNYYITRWDRGRSVTIRASTEPSARGELARLLAPAERHHVWVTQLDSIKPVTDAH